MVEVKLFMSPGCKALVYPQQFEILEGITTSISTHLGIRRGDVAIYVTTWDVIFNGYDLIIEIYYDGEEVRAQNVKIVLSNYLGDRLKGMWMSIRFPNLFRVPNKSLRSV